MVINKPGKNKSIAVSLRAKLEFSAYQSLFGTVSLFGAGSVPILGKVFPRVEQGFSHYLGRLPLPPKKPTIWIHGVSMGESLVAIGFAIELRKHFPEIPLVFTSTHPDVLATVKKRAVADVVAYFPLDNLVSMRRAFDRWQPAAVFISETDFWPAFSWVCKQRSVPLALINGRVSEKIVAFYSKAVGLAEIIFSSYSKFLVQSNADSERLLALGVAEQKIEVAGNVKADLVPKAAELNLDKINIWKNNRKLVIFGSLHPTEFSLLLPTFKELAQQHIAIIIAPRNIENCGKWALELDRLSIKTCLRTSLREDPTDVMMLDTMGELAGLYGIAHAAFVGGTLDAKVGGHNPLEVIQQYVPLLMGPSYRNFADIVEQLQLAEAVDVCESATDALTKILQVLCDSKLASHRAAAATKILNKNRGALKRTVEIAVELIKAGCGDNSK